MEEIRELTDEDVDAAWDLSRQAFNLGDDRRERFGEVFQPDRSLGLFEDGRMVGKVVTHELGQWFGRRAVPMGGLAGVSVAPEHRGARVTTQLLEVELGRMRERGEVISTLYPAAVAPYRRSGWEVAGSRVRRTVSLRSLAGLPRPSGPVEIVEADLPPDLETFAGIYDRAARDHPGWVDRDERWFRERAFWWTSRDHAYAYLAHDGDGEVTGYIVYHHTSGREGEFYGLGLDELVAVDRDSTLALWRVLASNRGVSGHVAFHGGPEEPLYLLLAEQDTDVEQDWRWMTRLVDLPGALAARGWPAGAELEAHLEVADAQLAANAGRWVLTVRDGEAHAERGGDGTVRAPIGALAPLYTGMVSARTLARLGLVEGADEATLGALDDAFASPAPWMVDFF